MLTYYVMPGLKIHPSLPTRVVSPDRILFIVCHYFNVTMDELQKVKRIQSEQTPVQVGMYLLNKYCVLTLREIAILFGNDDHTRSMHNINKVKGWVQVDDKFRNIVNEIESLI